MEVPMKTIPGYFNSKPGIQIGTKLELRHPVPQMGFPTDDFIKINDKGKMLLDKDTIQFIQQMGIEWLMVTQLPEHSVARYREVKDMLAEQGLKIYRIANNRLHNMKSITLGFPDRDKWIEEYLQYITNLGAAGIHYATYAHMSDGIWRDSVRRPVRGGAIGTGLDFSLTNHGTWDEDVYDWPLSHGREYSEEEIWENYEYFIKQVVPVAESAGVFIGVHPDDPPGYTIAGVPRCIFGTFEGYKRAIDIADSPNIGACLCTGCWFEAGAKLAGSTPVEFIKYFGERKKLFKVHVRNVTGSLDQPGGFNETFPDAGYGDLIAIIKALDEIGYDGCIINDHLIDMVGGPYVPETYFTSYLKGVTNTVQHH